MTTLTDLVAFLDSHLSPSDYDDRSLNGLQVEGRAAVRKVALGVSASLRLFEDAIAWGADAVVVHHGLLWEGQQQRLVGAHARRVRALLVAETSLLAYHLPLDAHAEDGNNALIAKGLGLVDVAPWGGHRRTTIGAIGRLASETTVDQLVARLATTCGGDGLEVVPVVLGDRGVRPHTVAICSGGASSMLDQAASAGANVFVTGEAGEPSMQLALETGMLVVAAGHYNTERLGVQAIGRRLEAALGLEARFFEIPNPI
jgi:dinuclear metal center YbgI/SA1388 family protein